MEAAVLSMIHFYASAQPQGRSATQPPPSQTSQIPAAPLSQVPQPPVAAEHNDSTGFDSGSRKEMIAGKSDPACGSSFEQKPMQQQSATVSPLAEGIDVQKIPREARMALTNNTTIRWENAFLTRGKGEGSAEGTGKERR